MNFEEFKQQLMEDLKEALSRRVGTEVAVEENEVHKLQQESYDGIVVRKENESIGVNVDILPCMLILLRNKIRLLR